MATHRERRKYGVEDCAQARYSGVEQTSECGLSEMAHYQPAPVFKPAYAGTRSEVYPRWSEYLRNYQGPGCALPGTHQDDWLGQ